MRHIGYRPPSKMPTTKWALFLHAQQKKHDWNNTEAFRQLGPGLKLGTNSRTAYSDGLLTGKTEPDEDQQRFLIEFFGEEPQEAPAPVEIPSDQAMLVAAINSLVVEIQADREARRNNTWRRLESLEQEVAKLREERLTWERSVGTSVREAVAEVLAQLGVRAPTPPGVSPQ